MLLVEQEATWVDEQTAGHDLVAPAILLFELGNVFWKRLRRQASDADQLIAIWAAWTASFPVQLVEPDPVSTLRLAHQSGLTFYDASYVSVAQARDADLVSLDAQLVRTARRLGLRALTPQTTPRSRN